MRYTDDSVLPEVNDELFKEIVGSSIPLTVMILRAGPKFQMPAAAGGPGRDPNVAKTIMEHGRRNLRLRIAGLMPIICPIADGSGVTGIGIFNADPDQVRRIMDDDPGVKAGIFTFDIHPSRSFPGSRIPEPEPSA